MSANVDLKKLIEIVRDHPILYDTQDREYKDVTRKSEVWNDIALRLGIDNGHIVKVKWRNLRDSYLKYLRSSSSSIMQPTRRYQKWPWAGQMEFLKPHILNRQAEYSSRAMEVFDYPDVLPKVKNEPSMKIDGQEVNPNRDEVSNMSYPMETNEDLDASNSRYAATHCGLQNGGCAIVGYSKERPSVKRHMDAFDLLFLGYAEILKGFSLRRQAETKMKIAQLMYDAEMEHIIERETIPQVQYSCTPSPSSSSMTHASETAEVYQH